MRQRKIAITGPRGCAGEVCLTETYLPDCLTSYKKPTESDQHYENFYQQRNPLEATRIVQYSKTIDVMNSLGLNSQSKVLDVGCGAGLFLDVLKDKVGIEGVGIEPAVSDDARIVNGTLENALQHFEEASFDFITLFDVFEHMHSPELALKQLKTLLKKDGRLVLKVPNKKSLLYRCAISFSSLPPRRFWKKLLARIYQIEYPPPHFFYYSKESLRSIVEANGFRPEYDFYLSEVYLKAFLSRLWDVRPFLKPLFFGCALAYRCLALGGLKDSYVLISRK